MTRPAEPALPHAMEAFFDALQAVFNPMRKVKRRTRSRELVRQGRHSRSGTRRKDLTGLGRLDAEAGCGAFRVIGEEAVHLMQQGEDKYADEVPDVDDMARAKNADREDSSEPFQATASMKALPGNLDEIITRCQENADNQAMRQLLFTEMWEDDLLKHKAEFEAEAMDLRYDGQLNGKTVDELCQIFVKEAILHSGSEYELLQRAELLIDDSWLASIDDLPGNIYIMAAFGEFDRASQLGPSRTASKRKKSAGAHELRSPGGSSPTDAMSENQQKSGCSWFNPASIKAKVRVIGFFAIFIIQIIGPPLVFFSALPHDHAVGVDREENGWRWNELGRGQWLAELGREWRELHTTKLLGILFLFAFILNASYVAYDNLNTFRQIYDMFLYLNKSTPNFNLKGNWWLFIGACVNCWVVLWCSLDAAFVIGSAQTPKDILLDALGIIFLYNLDDVGGDFAFVDEDDWPGTRLGWIATEMVGDSDAGKKAYRLRKSEERSQAADQETGLDKRMRKYGILVYKFTIIATGIMSIILPVANALLPFTLFAPDD